MKTQDEKSVATSGGMFNSMTRRVIRNASEMFARRAGKKKRAARYLGTYLALNMAMGEVDPADERALERRRELIIIAMAIATGNDAPDGIYSAARRWHGNINDQMANIDAFLNHVAKHKDWPVPANLVPTVSANYAELVTLVAKCRTNQATLADRTLRNALLKSTVGLCLKRGRAWAYEMLENGTMTVEDIHLLGFLLVGETAGHRERVEPTDERPETKVKILNADYIEVVIDRSIGENAARVTSGWPRGVRTALIVVTSTDGKVEVYRHMTTHLHNRIKLPAGSHGKQFIATSAFLRHVDDEPLFGTEAIVSMPYTDTDLHAMLDHQHHQEFEEHLRAIEQHRQELERLEALEAAKK
jgi:hypothetical protein